MTEIVTIGLDLAKNVFQVHDIDTDGRVSVCRKLRRAEVLRFFATLSPCLVGMEACASSHYRIRRRPVCQRYDGGGCPGVRSAGPSRW